MRIKFLKTIPIKERRRLRHKLLTFAAIGIAMETIAVCGFETGVIFIPNLGREIVTWLHVSGSFGSVCGSIACLIGRGEDFLD